MKSNCISNFGCTIEQSKLKNTADQYGSIEPPGVDRPEGRKYWRYLELLLSCVRMCLWSSVASSRTDRGSRINGEYSSSRNWSFWSMVETSRSFWNGFPTDYECAGRFWSIFSGLKILVRGSIALIVLSRLWGATDNCFGSEFRTRAPSPDNYSSSINKSFLDLFCYCLGCSFL